jgi:signal recognition particle receptor subunit beta
MAVFNYAKKEIDAKIVFYGPAISGKTTNLQFIHGHMKPDQRGKMVSLATNEDRTLFFDFLPIELESVRGFKTRFHLYTVPGQVYYGATRRAVLTGADGVVFVADSHADRMEDNLTSFKDLEDNLRYYGKKIETVPLIIQYNKRDLPNVLPVEELNQKLNRMNCPYFETVAVMGKGVFESLTMTCRLVLKGIENGVESRRTIGGPEKGATPPPAAPKGLRMEKPAGQPESPPPRLETMTTKGFSLDKEGTQPKGASSPLETPQARRLRQEKAAALPAETPPGAKAPPPPLAPKPQPLAAEKPVRLEEEKRPVEPLSTAGKTLDREKQELSFKIDNRGLAKKPAPAGERVRILSCGQPRVSSPGSVEIPLTLEVEGAEKSISVNLNLSLKLESLEPKLD